MFRIVFRNISHGSITNKVHNATQAMYLQQVENRLYSQLSTPTQNVPAPSSTASAEAAPSLAKSKTISKAMKAYLERAKEHDEFISTQITEFEIGRRHLANIMGENPETFSQEDIDRAIQYLFPSGLFEPRARPFLKHPYEVFPKRKAAEFDASGRPFHSLFYTGRPNYYQTLHDIQGKVQELNALEDRMYRLNVKGKNDEKLNIQSTKWCTLEQVENILLEKLKEEQYTFLITSLERLCEHPLAYKAEPLIVKFRKTLTASVEQEIPKLIVDDDGRTYMTATGKRKWALAQVVVRGQGSGKISINGQDLHYFRNPQEREQVIFPLQFTNLIGKVDVEATVELSGDSAQAGAVRHGISLALMSFVDKHMVEEMRLAGLLTRDRRHRERKKPGQKGARAKYTWKKR